MISLTDRQRRTLMHDRYVLLQRRHDLDERGQLTLTAWTQTFPVLAQAYDAKEGFYDIWKAVGEQEPRTQYQDWRKQLPHELETAFEPLTTTMDHWQQEIVAYFTVLGTSATNATTEASLWWNHCLCYKGTRTAGPDTSASLTSSLALLGWDQYVWSGGHPT